MGGNLRSDSPLCRRVVLAFFDFLDSVEPAPGIDLEGIDVARECLEEAFKLNQSSIHDEIQPGLLIDLFTSSVADEQPNFLAAPLAVVENIPCTTSACQQTENSSSLEASNSDDRAADLHSFGVSKDELLGKFLAALDKTNFFMASPDGVDNPDQLSKAIQFFNDALTELENSQGQADNLSRLADILKSKGNQAMQLKLHCEAVELYTCAIALCEKNAVYYCNRAAAYTELQRYSEAIDDCLKSIEIDPKYSKAYSRLGVANYSQGNYMEAHQSFLKALQLDPSNDSVKESIRAAERKLFEQFPQPEAAQNTGTTSSHESAAQAPGSSQFTTSIPIHASIPSDFANIFRNMASAAHDPTIAVDTNLNIGGPEGISDALRSISELFSQQQRTQGGGMPRGGEQT